MKVGVIVILGILVVVFYRILLWLMEAARTPDPWGPEVEGSLDGPEATPVCPHCLAPQVHNGWFCPECGSTVGPYCNWLPGVYIFSIGEAFRRGVAEPMRSKPLVIAGYILISLAYFSLLAPISWILLFVNLRRATEARQSEAAS